MIYSTKSTTSSKKKKRRYNYNYMLRSPGKGGGGGLNYFLNVISSCVSAFINRVLDYIIMYIEGV